MVKNTLELYPEGGLVGAVKHFDEAYEWAAAYSFSSLGDYATKRNSSIVTKDLLGELFSDPATFKSFAKDCILGRKPESASFLDFK